MEAPCTNLPGGNYWDGQGERRLLLPAQPARQERRPGDVTGQAVVLPWAPDGLCRDGVLQIVQGDEQVLSSLQRAPDGTRLGRRLVL